jgi:hypothetical protein
MPRSTPFFDFDMFSYEIIRRMPSSRYRLSEKTRKIPPLIDELRV